jgi:hypothetical protein
MSQYTIKSVENISTPLIKSEGRLLMKPLVIKKEKVWGPPIDPGLCIRLKFTEDPRDDEESQGHQFTRQKLLMKLKSMKENKNI